MDPLEDGGYPALHGAADAASLQGQRRFLVALRIRLGGLLLATVGGGVVLSIGCAVAGGWVALLGFLTALAAGIYISIARPEKAWYEGRAAAESVKTLAWRYAVRGEMFATTVEPSKVDREFVQSVVDVLSDLDEIDLSHTTTSEQITSKMRGLRASDFATRRAAYREGRIEDQRSWYADKALFNGTAAHRWGVAVVVAEGLGVVGGVLLVTQMVTLDLVALFAAVAATITAWTQARQHRTLNTAYSVTAQELAAVISELDALADESSWPAFVGGAEEAISREHTLWRASRGIRIRPRA